MELIRPIASGPPWWWTGGGGLPLLQNVKRAPEHISVQPTAPLQDLFSVASSIPITSRTSVEAMLQGTKIRLIEMRVKLMHKFPQSFDGGGGQAGFIGLTGATDLHRRHRLTLESTLGSDEDRHSMSAFISSKFEPRISWGIAVSQRFHQAVTYFARFSSDESSRHRFIVQCEDCPVVSTYDQLEAEPVYVGARFGASLSVIEQGLDVLSPSST